MCVYPYVSVNIYVCVCIYIVMHAFVVVGHCLYTLHRRYVNITVIHMLYFLSYHLRKHVQPQDKIALPRNS